MFRLPYSACEGSSQGLPASIPKRAMQSSSKPQPTTAVQSQRRFERGSVVTAVLILPEQYTGPAAQVGLSRRSYLCEDRAGRVSLLNRRPDDLPAARFDNAAADDGVFSPVGAFDEYVRCNCR